MAAIVPAIAALVIEDERERHEREDEEDRLERERMEDEGGPQPEELDRSVDR